MKETHLNKIVYIRFLLVTITILTTVLFISSCHRSNEIDLEGQALIMKPPADTLNFEGHWLNEGDREKLLREVVNDYGFTHQNTYVNLKFPEQIMKNVTDDNEINFIIEQIKKPVADWDILRIKSHYGPIASKLNDPDWGKKYLVDFTNIPGYLESHKAFINNPDLRASTGGILMGPYNEGQLWALFVNTKVAKKMGITVKQYGMTFDDFAGYLKAAYEYNQTHSYIAPIFEEANWITMDAVFKRLFYSINGTYAQDNTTDFTQHKFESIEKCYRALGTLAQYKPMIRDRKSIVWARDNDYPLKDSCLFFINGTWMYNIWKLKGQKQMDKILPCELPVFQPCDSYLGGYACNWCIPKNAPHLKEAIKFMMYWCRPEIAEKWVRYTKCPSGTKGNLTHTSFGIDPYESFMYTIDNKYTNSEFAQDANQYMFGVKNYKVQLRCMDVLEGRITAQQAIDELKRVLKY